MRYALLLGAFAALVPSSHAAREGSQRAPTATICYYNHRQRVVETQTMRCIDAYEAKFDYVNNFRFECGVRNTFNLFGSLCERPCHSAVRGVGRYALHNKTVVYGPALLPTSADNKWAFVLFEGSCHQLREKLQRGEKASFDNLLDDTLIKAAELAPPGRG